MAMKSDPKAVRENTRALMAEEVRALHLVERAGGEATQTSIEAQMIPAAAVLWMELQAAATLARYDPHSIMPGGHAGGHAGGPAA